MPLESGYTTGGGGDRKKKQPPTPPATVPVTQKQVAAAPPAPVVQPAAPPPATMPETGGIAPQPGDANFIGPVDVRTRWAPPAPVSAPTPAPAPAVARTTGYNAPSFEEQWWNAFTTAHNGVSPYDYYRGDMDQARADRAWGDKFYDLYKRVPSWDDWTNSYYDRRLGGGGGGGYGGGGGAYGYAGNTATTPTMSPMWNAIFGTYYSTRPERTTNDYSAFLNQWANKAGRQPTPDEATRILTAYQNYLLNRTGSTASYEDLMAFMARYMAQPAALPPISYLQTGQI